MVLTPTDYAVLTAAAGGAVVGLFIGFSGMVAFLSGSVASAFCATFGWSLLECLALTPWLRVLAVVVGSLLAFGLVRMLVRRFIHVMIAQPGDAIFGALAAGAVAGAVGLGAVWLANLAGILPCPSALLDGVLGYVG